MFHPEEYSITFQSVSDFIMAYMLCDTFEGFLARVLRRLKSNDFDTTTETAHARPLKMRDDSDFNQSLERKKINSPFWLWFFFFGSAALFSYLNIPSACVACMCTHWDESRLNAVRFECVEQERNRCEYVISLNVKKSELLSFAWFCSICMLFYFFVSFVHSFIIKCVSSTRNYIHLFLCIYRQPEQKLKNQNDSRSLLANWMCVCVLFFALHLVKFDCRTPENAIVFIESLFAAQNETKRYVSLLCIERVCWLAKHIKIT